MDTAVFRSLRKTFSTGYLLLLLALSTPASAHHHHHKHHKHHGHHADEIAARPTHGIGATPLVIGGLVAGLASGAALGEIASSQSHTQPPPDTGTAPLLPPPGGITTHSTYFPGPVTQ